MYTSQELTDRLCVATEEQDVVFVAVWIAEMRERGYLPQAINAKHSWKGISALDSLVQSDFNSLRKIIMELLILSGGDVNAKETLDLAMEAKNLEALRIMILWDKGGKEQAIDARNLLSIDLIAASDWIDFNLPQPPNPESLTGLNPLPSPPPPDSSPSESPAPVSDAECSSPTPQQPSSSSSPTSAIQPQSRVCLVLNWLPRGFSPAQVQSLFDQIGVASEVVLCDTKIVPSVAWIDVPADQAQFCISNLDKQRIGGRGLSCRHIDWDSSRRHLSKVQRATPTSNSASHTNFATSNANQPRSCMRLGGIPFDYLPLQVWSLFRSIGVEGIVTVCQTKAESRFAFVEVPLDQSRHCINRLDGKDLSGCKITCNYGARPSAGPYRSLLPLPPSGSSSMPSPSPTFDSSPASGFFVSSISPGSDSTSTPSLMTPLALPVLHYTPSHLDRQPREHNLLVLNLHLSNSSVTSDLLPKLPNYTLFSHSPTQSVAFVKARSAEEAKKLKNAWDRFVIGGQQLRVVDAKDEVTPEEAVKDYFGTYLDKIQSIEEKHEVAEEDGTARKNARLSE